jgi:hypothetical protein
MAPNSGLYMARTNQKEKNLRLKRINLIKEYVDNFSNLTPDLADKTAKSALSNNISLSKLNLDYYKKVKKALGSVRAAKFMQLETYLQNSWRSYVQDNNSGDQRT